EIGTGTLRRAGVANTDVREVTRHALELARVRHAANRSLHHIETVPAPDGPKRGRLRPAGLTVERATQNHGCALIAVRLDYYDRSRRAAGAGLQRTLLNGVDHGAWFEVAPAPEQLHGHHLGPVLDGFPLRYPLLDADAVARVLEADLEAWRRTDQEVLALELRPSRHRRRVQPQSKDCGRGPPLHSHSGVVS